MVPVRSIIWVITRTDAINALIILHSHHLQTIHAPQFVRVVFSRRTIRRMLRSGLREQVRIQPVDRYILAVSP